MIPTDIDCSFLALTSNISQTYPENCGMLKNTTENISEEITHLNGISIKVLAIYLWNGGHLPGIISVLVLALLAYFNLIISKNYLLVWWIMASEENITLLTNSTHLNMTLVFNPLRYLSLNSRIYTFITFCLLVSILLLFSNISISWTAATASYRLYRKMQWKVLRAPSTFFYSNFTGSIINRFSKDIATMDHLLPKTSHLFLLCNKFHSIHGASCFYRPLVNTPSKHSTVGISSVISL